MMVNKSLVSIIVPIFKVEEYLHKCIESIIGQTYKNIEIILVDDGSPDSCPGICDEYAQKDERIKVLHKRNEGLVKARQDGLGIATGDYIQFVDGDDWIDVEFTAKMLDYIEKYNLDIVMCGYYLCSEEYVEGSSYFAEGFYGRNEIVTQIFPKMICTDRYFEFGIVPMVWNKLYRKELLLKRLPDVNPQISFGEDAACFYPLMLDINSIFIIKEPLYFYRQNNNSMTRAFGNNQTENTIALIKYLNAVMLGNDSLKDIFQNQVDRYLFITTEGNLVNTARAGFGHVFLKRWRQMYQFVKETKLREAVKRQNMQEIPIKSRILIEMTAYGFGFVVMFYQAVVHRFSQKRKKIS